MDVHAKVSKERKKIESLGKGSKKIENYKIINYTAKQAAVKTLFENQNESKTIKNTKKRRSERDENAMKNIEKVHKKVNA